MASSNDNIQTLETGKIIIPVGATLAVKVAQIPEQVALTMKYFTGGTLEIIGITAGPGATYSASQLATLSGNGYLVDSTEVLNYGGPTAFYLSSTGATTTVYYQRGMNKTS